MPIVGVLSSTGSIVGSTLRIPTQPMRVACIELFISFPSPLSPRARFRSSQTLAPRRSRHSTVCLTLAELRSHRSLILRTPENALLDGIQYHGERCHGERCHGERCHGERCHGERCQANNCDRVAPSNFSLSRRQRV